MLGSRNPAGKSYEELMEEALIQIPLYSKEWTNYNQSDPGITIVENFSAFQLLQQEYMNQIPDSVKRKLLKLVGFTEIPGKSARVLLEAVGVEEAVVIPANQRFLVGDVSFETNRQMELNPYQLTAVYRENKGKLTDLSVLLERNVPVVADIFGNHPKKGDSIYLVMNGIPKDEEIICYAAVKEKYKRNLPEDSLKNMFAKIRWQCYTGQDYEDIRCKDATGAFLSSGEIRFSLSGKKPAWCSDLPKEGYVIRGILEKADYDVAPRVSAISGFLFEVWQKETQSLCYTYPGGTGISVFCDLLEEGYFHIYCRDRAGGSYYRYERLADGDSRTGRFYHCKRYGYGMYEFTFPDEERKKGKGRLRNGIKLAVYNEEMMRQYFLDTVYGYDNQTVSLPLKNIVPESFSVIAERKNEKGECIYDFIRPGRREEGMLCYELDETEGQLLILDAGDFIDAKLYLCSSAVTRGGEGNVSEGKVFAPVGYQSEVRFVNPGPGTGGRFKETLEEMRERFVQDVNDSSVLVTAEDYEKIVKATPGLLIHKVKAVTERNGSQNEVMIAVKPYGEEEFPKLSELYQAAIRKHLEKCRLITTRIRLTGPVYLPVNVQGLIYVRQYYADCGEVLKREIRNYLDYRMSGSPFGALLRFDELYHRLEVLSCVAYIHEFTMAPQYANMALMEGNDIQLSNNCLSVPGTIQLEIRRAEK